MVRSIAARDLVQVGGREEMRTNARRRREERTRSHALPRVFP
jgi:hypothetical protein